MNLENAIIDKLKAKKLSDSSIKNYIRNVQILNGGKNINSLTFLNNTESIQNKIDQKKFTTQRNYYIAIVSILKTLDKPIKKTLKYYYDKMMSMNDTYKDQLAKNEKTDTQAKNWVEFDDLKKKLDELVDTVKQYPKEINKTQYKNVLSMIVLALYILQAPRRNADYQYMDVRKSKTTDENINFLLYEKKQFVFKKYKTAKTENVKNGLVVDINNELMEVIKLYFKYHPLIKGKKILEKDSYPFLVGFNGSPLPAVNSITYILNSAIGKKVGSSQLRHIFLSSKYGKVLEEMKKDSQNMSHGLATQKSYVKTN